MVMRRNPPYRYLINKNIGHFEVHDLDNEKTGYLECQIDEIISAGHAMLLINIENEEQLLNWLKQNPEYDGCYYCLSKFHRK